MTLPVAASPRNSLCLVALCVASWACGGKTPGQPSDAGMHEATTGVSESSGTVATSSGTVSGTGSESGNPVRSGSSGNASPADGGEPLSGCDPRACSSGCCGPTGCLAGTSADACGFGGQACTDCTAIGLDCVSALSGSGGGVCGP